MQQDIEFCNSQTAYRWLEAQSLFYSVFQQSENLYAAEKCRAV